MELGEIQFSLLFNREMARNGTLHRVESLSDMRAKRSSD